MSPVAVVRLLDVLTSVGISVIAVVTAIFFDAVAGALFGLFVGGAFGLFLAARDLDW